MIKVPNQLFAAMSTTLTIIVFKDAPELATCSEALSFRILHYHFA